MSFQIFSSTGNFLERKDHRQSLRASNGSEAIFFPAIKRLLHRFAPRKDGLYLIIAAMVLVSSNPPILHACPGCGAALNSEVGYGFNLSILYMMAMPFVVFAGVVFGIVYITRQNRSKKIEYEKTK